MADRVVDTFSYVDDGRIITKNTWQDDQGHQWDTFDTTHETAGQGLANGTVVEPQQLMAQTEAVRQQNPGLRQNPGGDDRSGPQSNNMMSDLSYAFGRGTAYADNSQKNTSTAAPTTQSAVRTNEGSGNVSYNPNNPLAPRPTTPAPTGGGGFAPPVPPQITNPGSGVPGQTGASPTVGELGRDATLYNWDNPTQSVVNALRATGFNMDSNSPVLQMLLRAAPGLANAYKIQGAAGNDQNPNKYGEFGSFLQSNLSQGLVPSVLRGAQSGLSNIMDQVRAYARADQSNNPLAGNELLGSLAGSMSQNNGAGILDILNSINSPFMSRTGAGAYQNLLAGPTGLGSQAQSRWAMGVDPVTGSNPTDYWYNLLGF